MTFRGQAMVPGSVFSVLVAIVLLSAAAGAATLSLTPSGVTSEYSGTVTLNIGGLSGGQVVQVDTFVDFNGSGTVDAGEMLVQSFQVTDGQALQFDGHRNGNVPGDEDGAADGKIRAVLNFKALAEYNEAVARFVYRVIPIGGGFAPVVASLTIAQPSYAQKVVGQVTSGGAPVAYAGVFLLDLASNGGPKDTAVADASGNFRLNAAPGTYTLAVLKAGFVVDLTASPMVTLLAGATVTQNLSIVAADRTISGRLSDVDNGTGIPGVQLFVQSDSGLTTLVFSDADGNFVAPVSSAATQWTIEPSERSLALSSYLHPRDRTVVDISSGNVSSVSIQVPKVTALIFGTLDDDQARALVNVRISAEQDRKEGFGLTDNGGNYFVGVTAGTWNLNPDEDTLAALGYLATGSQVTLSAGQAMRVDLVVYPPCAHLRGHVIDNTSAPIDNVSVYACGSSGSCPGATTAADGSFDIGVNSGTWNLSVSSDDLAPRGLLGSSVSTTVACGQDQNNLTLTVLRATAQISGGVQDNSGDPISGLGVYTYANIGGSNYNVYVITDGNGNYALPVVDGSWQVGLDCNDLTSRGLPCPGSRPVTVSGQNQVADFCVGCGAHLRGTVFDDSGGRVAAIHILAAPQFAGTGTQALTKGNGDFDIALTSSNGAFTLVLSAVEAAQRGLVSPVLTETVAGNDINSILFVAKHSTALITGSVVDTNGNPIAGLSVTANVTVNPINYRAGANTDSSGTFQLPVVNGNWTVGLNCNELSARGFNCVAQQYPTVNNNNPVVSFIVQGVLRVTTSSLPSATQGAAYATPLQASGGQQPYTWSLGDDTPFLPPNLSLDAANGTISGMPVISGTFSVHVIVHDHIGYTADARFTLSVNP
ncbi:MAG: carboxypeptidase regulatory-like domain-containing protein, partial [Deltaproteobacteria bacterium]|nr:carboxypeptidase regulatory-like domain-containing protein [Deltaproteobacteria bacterium]